MLHRRRHVCHGLEDAPDRTRRTTQLGRPALTEAGRQRAFVRHMPSARCTAPAPRPPWQMGAGGGLQFDRPATSSRPYVASGAHWGRISPQQPAQWQWLGLIKGTRSYRMRTVPFQGRNGPTIQSTATAWGDIPKITVPSPPEGTQGTRDTKQNMQTRGHMNHKMTWKLPVGIDGLCVPLSVLVPRMQEL